MLITRLLLVLEVLLHCLYGGYNLHRFSDALGLVLFDTNTSLHALHYHYLIFWKVMHYIMLYGKQFTLLSFNFMFHKVVSTKKMPISTRIPMQFLQKELKKLEPKC